MSDVKFKHYTKKFNIIESSPKYYEPLDAWYRDGTSDKVMFQDCIRNYGNIETQKDDIVLDLGANIGGAGKVFQNKVEKVISVEADNFNFQVLEHNLKDHSNCINLCGAVVGPGEYGEANFMVNNSANNACSMKITPSNIKNFKRKDKLFKVVPTYSITDLYQEYKPTILKMDIEGYEYNILKENIPDHIHTICLELHGSNKAMFLKMIKIVELLKINWAIDNFWPVWVFGGLSCIELTGTRKDFKNVDMNLDYIDDNKSFQEVKGILKENPTQNNEKALKQIDEALEFYKDWYDPKTKVKSLL